MDEIADDRPQGASETKAPPPSSAATETFLDLYTSHYSRLQFYLMAIAPTASDAADILQETSLVLWRRFDTFEPGTNFYAWACKIARLQAMKFRQRQGRAGHVFDAEVLEKLADEARHDSHAAEMPLDILEACLQRLTEYDRSLIRKRYQPGASVKDIALELGRSANSLCKSLGRIRRALLGCIQRKLGSETV